MVQKEVPRVTAKSQNGQSGPLQGNSKEVIKSGKQFEKEISRKHEKISEQICDPQSTDIELDKSSRESLYKTGSKKKNLIHWILSELSELSELDKEPAPLKALKLVEDLVLCGPGLFTQHDDDGKTPLLEAARHNVRMLFQVIDLLIPESVLKNIKIPCDGRASVCPLRRVHKGRQQRCSKDRYPTGSASPDEPEQAGQFDGLETTEVGQDEIDAVKVEGSCLCNITDTNKMETEDGQLRETLKAALGLEQERQPLCLHELIVNLEPKEKEPAKKILPSEFETSKFKTLLQLCPNAVFESTNYDGYTLLQTAIRLFDKPRVDYQELFAIIKALVNRLPSSIYDETGRKALEDEKTTAYRLLKGLNETEDSINAQCRSWTEDLFKRICIGSTKSLVSKKNFLYRDAKSVRQICLNLISESSRLDESYISRMVDKSRMRFETVMVYVKLPYWKPQHEMTQHQGIAHGHREGVGNDAVAAPDPYIAIFDWLHAEGVRKIFTVEVDDSGPDPHTNFAIRQSLRGSSSQGFSRDFEIEVWNWKKFDICSETIFDAAPMAKEVHLYSSGNTAVLRSWGCSSGLRKLTNLQQLYINIQPRNSKDKKDCDKYIPELKKKLADRCQRLECEKIKVKYPDSQAASAGSKRADQTGGDGENQEDIRQNPSNATLKAGEWIEKLAPFVEFIRNLPIREKPSVRVALLDDGANLDELHDVHEGESFRPDNVGYFVGSCSHGTQMAECIRRICPMAELYIARLDDSHKRDGEKFTTASAFEALNWARSMGADIISMSWTFKMKVNDRDEHETKFIDLIQSTAGAISVNKPVLFGSLPDKGPTAEAVQYAPVGLQGVIRIASATIYGERSKENAQENPDFLLPGENIELSGEDVSGSSFSTAYASGLAALVLYCLRAHEQLGVDLKIPDQDDERAKRRKMAETVDGMKKIFTSFTRNAADNGYKRDPFLRPYRILGNKNFGDQNNERWKAMNDIASQLLPITQ